MSDFIIAVILGIVEGLTEFLPVSSTGHLILTGHLLGFVDERADTFEVVIQLGAILAIVVLYWQRMLSLVGIGSKAGSNKDAVRPHKGLSLLHLVAAALPGVVVGVLLHGWIKAYMWSPTTVLIGLIAGGIFMIYAEKKQVVLTSRTMDDLTLSQALKIGLFQCISIILPGFSRSGATIAGGMLSGASLRAAADFSFILAVPMMIGASALDLYKSWDALNASDFNLFATGFVVSFIVAMLAVVSFLKLLEKVRLTSFAYYRFFLAFIFLMYMLFVGL